MSFGSALDSLKTGLLGTESPKAQMFDIVVDLDDGQHETFTAEIKGAGDAATLDVFTDKGDKAGWFGAKPDVALRREVQAWLSKHGKEIIEARNLYTDGKSDNNLDHSLDNKEGNVAALYGGVKVFCGLKADALDTQYGKTLVEGAQHAFEKRDADEAAAKTPPPPSAEQALKTRMGDEQAQKYDDMVYRPVDKVQPEGAQELAYAGIKSGSHNFSNYNAPGVQEVDSWVFSDKDGNETVYIPQNANYVAALIRARPDQARVLNTLYDKAEQMAVQNGLAYIDGDEKKGYTICGPDRMTEFHHVDSSDDPENQQRFDNMSALKVKADTATAEAKTAPLAALASTLKRIGGLTDDQIFAVVNQFIEDNTHNGKIDLGNPDTFAAMERLKAKYVALSPSRDPNAKETRAQEAQKAVDSLQAKSEPEVKKELRATLAKLNPKLDPDELDAKVDKAWAEIKDSSTKKPAEFYGMAKNLTSDKPEDKRAGRKTLEESADKTYRDVRHEAAFAQSKKIVGERLRELVEKFSADGGELPPEFAGDLSAKINELAQELSQFYDPKTGEVDETRANQYLAIKLRKIEERIHKFVDARKAAKEREQWHQDFRRLMPQAIQNAQSAIATAAQAAIGAMATNWQPADPVAPLAQQAANAQQMLQEQIKAGQVQNFLADAQKRGEQMRPASIQTPGPDSKSTNVAWNGPTVQEDSDKARRRRRGNEEGPFYTDRDDTRIG